MPGPGYPRAPAKRTSSNWTPASSRPARSPTRRKALSRNPEKLSGALQLFFRLEGLRTMLNSLQEGARKYQGPQVAQALAAVYAEGGANRERLRSYIINLAAEREHQFEVMDREAQRCRATFMAPAPPAKTPGRKK